MCLTNLPRALKTGQVDEEASVAHQVCCNANRNTLLGNGIPPNVVSRDQVAAAKSISASKESELQVFVVHGSACGAGVSKAKPFCSTAAALL